MRYTYSRSGIKYVFTFLSGIVTKINIYFSICNQSTRTRNYFYPKIHEVSIIIFSKQYMDFIHSFACIKYTLFYSCIVSWAITMDTVVHIAHVNMPVIWSTHMCMHAYTYIHTYTHIYTYIYTLSVIKLNNFFFRKIMSSVALSTYPPFLPVTAGHNINQYPKYLLIFFIKLIVVGNYYRDIYSL